MSTWYIGRRRPEDDRAGLALCASRDCLNYHRQPQWVGCSWRSVYEYKYPPCAFESKESAKSRLDELRVMWPNERSYCEDVVFVQVFTAAESRQRAEARGEVKALNQCAWMVEGVYRDAHEKLLADARKRAGL